MGYTHYLEVNKDFTFEEFEDIRADIARIVDVATDLGIPLCGYEDWEPVRMSSEKVVFNGVDEKRGETFILTRGIDRSIPYNPTLTFCKTKRNQYDPVVAAALMVIKQRVPQDVRIGSDGGWGHEWLHGPQCYDTKEDADCDNADPDHVGISGRTLYQLAFPDSPEPRYTFESPLISQGLEGQNFYVTRNMECKRRGTCFVGLPFGVHLFTLLEQSERVNASVCMVCGEETRFTIKMIAKKHVDEFFDGRPMCEYCYRERLLKGNLTGYGYAYNPFRLRDMSVDGMVFAAEPPAVHPRQRIQALRGMNVCATGRFSKMTRREVNAYIESLGGRAHTSVTPLTDILVTGKRVGAKKMNMARSFRVEVMSEAEFMAKYVQ